MYQTEKKLYQALKTNLPKVHWQRIETGALQQGVPDVNACYCGSEFWLELKVAQGDRVSMSPFQVSWHTRRANAGGRSWILVSHSSLNALTLHRGGDALRIMEDGLSSSVAFTYHAPIDWPQFLADVCLTDSLETKLNV